MTKHTIDKYLEKIPYHMTSVKISPKIYNLCKLHHISFAEAQRVGSVVLLAEKNVVDYDNDLNIVRQLRRAIVQLSETSQELEDLKEKLN